MDYSKIVLLCTNLPLVIVVVYFLIHYHSFNKEISAIKYFIFLSFFTQVIGVSLYLMGKNNLFLLHAFVPLGFVCLTVFYNKAFSGFISVKFMKWVVFLFVLFSVINSIFWQNIYSFNSYALSLQSALIIIYSLSLFAILLNQYVRREKKSFLRSLIWINSGLFIYYTTGLLLFYFGDLLTHFTPVKFRISWLFHSFIYLVMFVCIIIGLWKHPKK